DRGGVLRVGLRNVGPADGFAQRDRRKRFRHGDACGLVGKEVALLAAGKGGLDGESAAMAGREANARLALMPALVSPPVGPCRAIEDDPAILATEVGAVYQDKARARRHGTSGAALDPRAQAFFRTAAQVHLAPRIACRGRPQGVERVRQGVAEADEASDPVMPGDVRTGLSRVGRTTVGPGLGRAG